MSSKLCLKSCLAVVVAAACLTITPEADAQFRRGFAPRGGAYFGPTFVAPPLAYPPANFAPGSVRIRTPFFSMNVGPTDLLPPAYGYRYESDRPLGYGGYGYEYRFESGPSALTRPVIPRSYGSSQLIQPLDGAGINPLPESNYRYRPGAGGGIPEVTSAETFGRSSLQEAANQLSRSIQTRLPEPEGWLEYLMPNRIVEAVGRGDISALPADLARRYEAVTMNRELRQIQSLAGFQETRRLLGQWMARPSVPAVPSTTSPVEAAPLDQPRPAIRPGSAGPQSTDATDSGSSILTPADDKPFDARAIEPSVETLPAPAADPIDSF
ncbi:MAG: hypothetical protein AAF802_20300 [Planctomycetota bacterium]